MALTAYERLVIEVQENYMGYQRLYASGGTAVRLSEKDPLPYAQQIDELLKQIQQADVICVGGASGLSAAGGGDFYYADNASYRKYFGKYAGKYGFNGAFAGMMHRWSSRAEFWGYLATFLHTTIHADIRKPYLDLDALLQGKDFFIVTTNQDTQFVKLYPEDKVAEIQGDHRFFQCSHCCTDDTWDSVEIVDNLIAAMGEDTAIPEDMIPRCPHCGAEAFPWVRGYGNFLTETKYHEQYAKMSDFIAQNRERKILFLELGVGRMTPMFIQEPFWKLTEQLPNAYYVAVNDKYDYLPERIEDKGMVIVGDIQRVLDDALARKQSLETL